MGDTLSALGKKVVEPNPSLAVIKRNTCPGCFAAVKVGPFLNGCFCMSLDKCVCIYI